MQNDKPVLLSYVKLSEKALKMLEKHGVLYLSTSQGLEEILPRVEVVVCTMLNANHLKKMKALRMIQSVAAGVDVLPWAEIPEHVLVCGNAGSNADAVAEHAWALILTLTRNLHVHIPNMRRGVFDQSPGTTSLVGRTIGIIGMGAIGRRVAEIANAFKMRVLAVTKSGKTNVMCDFVGGPEAVDKVLAESDVVVLSAPLTKRTRGMIDLRRLNLMKKNCVLVNIARADLIRREDLLAFLQNNPEFRVATDVWWNIREEFRRDAEFMRYPNFIGTPWVAGGFGNPEVWENMVNEAAANVVRFLRGETPRNIIDRSDYV